MDASKHLLGLIATGSMPHIAREPCPCFAVQIPQHHEIEAVWATWVRENKAAKPVDWTTAWAPRDQAGGAIGFAATTGVAALISIVGGLDKVMPASARRFSTSNSSALRTRATLRGEFT